MAGNLFKRILAIDFGSKRIGAALSDPLQMFPSKILTLNNDINLIPGLLKIIEDQNVETIIVGNLGNENPSSAKLQKSFTIFTNELSRQSKLQIIFWDEHFTSKMAAERILESVSKKSKRRNKGLVDAHSAGIILEEYLKSPEHKLLERKIE